MASCGTICAYPSFFFMVQRTALGADLVKMLQERGFAAYFAGGCVRDMLLGLPAKDIDIATSAHPSDVAHIFAHTFTAGRQLGERFGVLSVVHEGEIFEIATFRADSAESDGRRPASVAFVGVEEDARRRDFTINALYYDPVADNILDFVGGQRDLEERLVRCIGDPAVRLQEDSLRLLRAVRFVHQIDGQYEPGTYAALRDHADLVQKVSWERIAQELHRMLMTPSRARALEDLQDLGLLTYVLPEVEALKGVAQPRQYHREGSVWNHAMHALASLPADSTLETIWGALLHDVGKAVTFSVEERIRFDGHAEASARIAAEILTRLRFPKKSKDAILWAIEHHMSLAHLLESGVTDKTRAAWFGHPAFPLLLAVHHADALGTTPPDDGMFLELSRAFADWQAQEQAKPPEVLTGHDIMEILHLAPSPRVGEIRAAAREAQLAGTFATYAEGKVWLLAQYA